MPKIRGLGKLRRRTPGSKWFFYLDGHGVTTPHVEYRAAEAWRRIYLADEVNARRYVGVENCTLYDLVNLAGNGVVNLRPGRLGFFSGTFSARLI